VGLGRPVRLLAAALVAMAGVVVASGAHRLDEPPGWLVYGNDAQRSGVSADTAPARILRPLWTRRLGGQITAQPLVVRDFPSPGRSTIVVGTSRGTVYALDDRGRALWHVRYGRARSTCLQLAGYGITGTPAIDPETSTLYVADSFGRLHALDLRTGRDRAGWPVVLFRNVKRELVWGALALVGGAVYVPTGALCDRPMEGKVLRVDPAGAVTATWIAVPMRLGGGGGIWGWGGIAYSASRDSLLVATGNAFRGGSNVGRRFSEAAGYGEQLVELDRELRVRSASHPKDIKAPRDLDFSGSPLVVSRPGCGELFLAGNKNNVVYAWRADAVSAGPTWSLRLPAASSQPFLGQLAFVPGSVSVVAVSHSRLTRVDIGSTCRPRVVWSRPIGHVLLNGSPTIAGGLVFFSSSTGKPMLQAVDLASGRVRLRAPLEHVSFVAPTIISGRAYVVTMRGELKAFALR